MRNCYSVSPSIIKVGQGTQKVKKVKEIERAHWWGPAWGFREPGEWVAKQPGSREHGEKNPREQGAEKLI